MSDDHDPMQDERRAHEAAPWQAIDLLLEQGSREELDAMRAEVTADPLRALEVADTVEFLDRLRGLQVESSQQFPFRMREVAARAARRVWSRPRQRTLGEKLLPLVAVLSAAATFTVLLLLQTGRHQRGFAPSVIADAELPPTSRAQRPAPLATHVLDAEQAAWQSAVDRMRQRLDQEVAPRLREAFERGLEEAQDPLAQWLEPRNAMMLLRIDHELRASAAVRGEALRRHGNLAAVDERVQLLADELAETILSDTPFAASMPMTQQVQSWTYGVRALVAAGSTPTRAAAIRRGGDRLAEAVPSLHGELLAYALSALTEVTAVTGDHYDLVQHSGARLVDEVLRADGDNWGRSRPDLLSARVSPAGLGEAGRLLAWLPGFGVDAARCGLVRNLVLGQLRELRERGQERPEVLAAMLYGVGDLLVAGERERVQFSLRRWKLARLAPDFVTVQQVAWGRRPGELGFTRLQGELRQLGVLALPETMLDRAAFCLCLATNFAGYIGDLSNCSPPPRD